MEGENKEDESLKNNRDDSLIAGDENSKKEQVDDEGS